jgi:cytochrome c peroxidase
MSKVGQTAAILIAFACVVGAVLSPKPVQASEALRQEALRHFEPLSVQKAMTAPEPMIELGRALYWDASISVSGSISCASCHPAKAWGADTERFSIDAKGEPGLRHTPTIFNSVYQPTLRWLGDRKSLAEQAEGSLTGSLGFPSRDAALARLTERGYEAAFRALFPRDPMPLTTKNYGAAVAAYEATLVTPGPFDRFLSGDMQALTAQQKAGLRAFLDTGCAACHAGPLLGGNDYQKFGLTRDYWLATGSTGRDQGRFTVTKKEDDRFFFRVPMLRNVARTGPYFHDGSVRQLDTAVKVMADLQLGTALDEQTTRSIVAFLNALTGPVPANYTPPSRPMASSQ